MRTAAFWAALVGIQVIAAGCIRITDSSDQTASKEELDELRALPYISFSEDDADLSKMGVVHHVPQRTEPGYNLIAVKAHCRADLLDMEGNLVHSWIVEPCNELRRVELLPGGDLLAIASVSFKSGFLAKLDRDGRMLWRKRYRVHHDVEITPANQILVLTVGRRRVPFEGREILIRDNDLALLDLEGRLLEKKSLFDMVSAEHPEILEYIKPRRESKASDMFHANSVEWMRQEHLFGTHPLYSRDHVLVSIRHQDIAAIFDWKEGRLVWWWGKGKISGPHDATLLPSGNILIFDNGLGRHWSRLVEVDPTRREIVWQYHAPNRKTFFTRGQGSAQRLANGNTLAANSGRGQAFEVTPDGEIVWDYFAPYVNRHGKRATIIRVKRHDAEYVEPWLEQGTS